jgi:nitrite reductase/ring-hydroxylating ferredoxin subunit
MTEESKPKMSRRTLLRLGGCAGVTVVGCGVTGVVVGTQTDLFDRIRGVTHTPLLENPDAWAFTDGTLTLALDQVPDLVELNSAVRLEDDAVPEPLLIVHGADGGYYVFVNRCTHAKRKIDLSDGQLKCTSISSAEYDYSGAVLSGPTDEALTTYTVAQDGDLLVITLA